MSIYLCILWKGVSNLSYLLRWLASAGALLIVTYLPIGVSVNNLPTALWAAFLLGLANITVKPLLLLFTIPITILTLGLFTFVINGLIYLLVSLLVPGFVVHGLLSAILGAILVGLIAHLLSSVLQAIF